jgi:hypothetical protein
VKQFLVTTAAIVLALLIVAGGLVAWQHFNAPPPPSAADRELAAFRAAITGCSGDIGSARKDACQAALTLLDDLARQGIDPVRCGVTVTEACRFPIGRDAAPSAPAAPR